MKKKYLLEKIIILEERLDIQDAKIERVKKYIEKQLELSVDLSLEFDRKSVIDKLK